MQIPLEVKFRNMEPSPAIEANIRERAGRLERFFDRVIGCRVVVEAPHRHKRKGKLYNVRIDLSVPRREFLVTRSGPQNHAHEDVQVAIRDAFDALARQLEDHARKARGDVKTHEAPLHGRIARLLPDYGFIETSDGREIYFHRNSVVGDGFDKLRAGGEVRLVMAEGESAKGPQATTVTPIGKHHLTD
ncbi:MAG: HPF/RaiA family ribosome-associated protein [Alphaproteobacteria bacterium]